MTDEKKVTPIPTPLMAKDIMKDPAKASDTNPLPVETIDVETLDQFAAMMADWHQRKVRLVNHMAKVPEGEVLEIADDKTGEKRDLKLVGDVHAALVLGLRMALSQFKELPFTFTTEESAAVGEASTEAIDAPKPESTNGNTPIEPSGDEPTNG